ncbi:MAG: aspartate kinase [Chitinophagaceae bacterium]|nr:aspartate kinase [Chitinophagaceae bacterium]
MQYPPIGIPIMQIYKFGGASIASPERAKALIPILQQAPAGPLVVVVSAKGKTTNALEEVVNTFMQGEGDKAMALLQNLEEEHLQYAEQLLGRVPSALSQKINELITEVYWVLEEESPRTYDYCYDQIVAVGELLSTAIISAYCQQEKLDMQWLDVRDILKTDSCYREAGIDYTATGKQVNMILKPALQKHRMVMLQGFIGSTDENNTVTLGREGSDYTAAIMGYFLDAEKVSIWKDVPGFLNADPKQFEHTQTIAEISFREVIEMTYYGAQIIHPKTIKPLQNKNIPLHVRCFLDPQLPGTLVHNTTENMAYPPLMVLKSNQVLLQVSTRDYAFITEEKLSELYQLFHALRIKINLIQNAAISFVACIDFHAEKLNNLLEALSKNYDVKRNEGVFLFTVRHYTEEILQTELMHRNVLLTQKTRQTIQVVAV